MKKSKITGLAFIFLLLSTLIIAGCSGAFTGANRGKCTEGDNCRYYTGNRGVMMYLDKPPRMFYYRSSELGAADGNSVDFNIRLLNDGASDSYGAVFVTGFSGDMFEICDTSSAETRCVDISKDRSSCYFDVMSLGKTVGDWGFLFGCFGATINTYGGINSVNLNSQFLTTIAKQFGYETSFIDDLTVKWGENGLLSFGIGIDGIGVMNYGRSLMLIVSSLNFEGLGGSVFTLKGDTAASPGGDIDFKTFEVKMIAPWPAGQDYFNIPYQIKSCYAYTTFVSPMICVDPDPFSEESKVCRGETYVWGGSQGAPVAVTRLQQTNTGKEVILDITIRNIGSGRVWDVGYLEGCSPYFPGKVKPSMLNVVYMGYAYIGNRQLDCSNYYKVRLDPNTQEARITCRYDMTDADDIGSAYTIPLRMELWYGYEETISNQLTVRKLN